MEWFGLWPVRIVDGAVEIVVGLADLWCCLRLECLREVLVGRRHILLRVLGGLKTDETKRHQ